MKTKTELAQEFLNLKSFALVGASSKKKKFGNEILKQMTSRGMRVFPIHKTADVIDGIKCYRNFSSLPEKTEGVVLVIPPAETEKVLEEISHIDIDHVWMQQGSENDNAIEYCRTHGIKAISKECILMFMSNAGFPHNVHKWIWNLGSKK